MRRPVTIPIEPAAHRIVPTNAIINRHAEIEDFMKRRRPLRWPEIEDLLNTERDREVRVLVASHFIVRAICDWKTTDLVHWALICARVQLEGKPRTLPDIKSILTEMNHVAARER